jgi:hypothetical protein
MYNPHICGFPCTVTLDKGNLQGKAVFVLKGDVTLFGKDSPDCGGDSHSLDSFADATVESTYDFPVPLSSPGLSGRSRIGPETARLLSPHALKRNPVLKASAGSLGAAKRIAVEG